jgi:hypothetical protein
MRNHFCRGKGYRQNMTLYQDLPRMGRRVKALSLRSPSRLAVVASIKAES